MTPCIAYRSLVGTLCSQPGRWRARARTVALALVAIGIGQVAGSANPAPALVVDTDAPIVTPCQADLAHRLKLTAGDVRVVEVQATTWPDASLGMPEIGKVYAQVQTPGWKIVLEARGAQYLYTASATTCRYGGPVSLWSSSLLYLVPVPNEPNLNGDLYQCSLLGTNCRRLVSGVTAYYPQADGAVITTRRTSRSSHDLLLVTAGKPEAPMVLSSALAFGAAALNRAQDTWAAFVRPRLGLTWTIVAAPVGQTNAALQTLSLPDGVPPGQIAWSGDQLMILVKQDGRLVCLATTPGSDNPTWQVAAADSFPGRKSYALNKSETLEVTAAKRKGRPCVEVARVWFTGDRNLLATISGVTLRGYDQLALRDYDFGVARHLVIWGEQKGKPATYTVDIATGEVIPGMHGIGQDPQPFAFPPASPPYRIVMAD